MSESVIYKTATSKPDVLLKDALQLEWPEAGKMADKSHPTEMSESVVYKTATSQPDTLLQDALQIELEASADDLASSPSVMTDRYEFIRKIGKGSQGQVWLAIRKSDGEKVAIKQFNIHSVTTWKQYELFKREAEVLSSLQLPGVVPFYEYVEDLKGKPPYVCIVQKYIEGKTVAEYRRCKHRFEAEAVYDIIVQVLKILRLLHEHKPQVIHRDIKPSNLMLTPVKDGRFTVTLLDFGAVANPQVQKGGSTVAGTFGYMPPEQLMGQAGPASDIYALASVAVELLSGVSPADIEVCDFKLVIEPYLLHLPNEVVQTLNMMLEPALDNRICDYNILIAQFTELAEKKKTSFLSRLRRTAVPELADVESICQPGNYEIWQNIDADKAFPVIQEKLEIAVQEKEKSKLHVSKSSYVFYKTLACFMLFISFMIPPVWGFIFFNQISVEEYLFLLPQPWLPFGGLCFVVSISLAVYLDGLRTKREAYYDSLRGLVNVVGQAGSGEMNTSSALHEIHQLMLHGQRLVGRIVHIQFEPVSYHHIKAFHSGLLSSGSQGKLDDKISVERKYGSKILMGVDNKTDENLDNKLHLFGLGEPVFSVYYTFQVKYLEKVYDFTGKLLTHVPPENHYKVGDPITLLATLTQDGMNRFLLKAMPFPYPFDEVLNTEDLIFQQIIPREVFELPGANSRYETIKSRVIGKSISSVDSHYKDAALLLSLWYSKATDTFAELMLELGHAHVAMFKQNKYHDKALPIIETAIKDYMIAFNLGKSESFRSLGHCVLNNELPQIPVMPMADVLTARETARNYFMTAFNNGCIDAALDLADMMLFDSNWKGALIWYEKAADIGNVEAAMKAGDMYLKYHVIEDDRENALKAISLYEIAAKQGHIAAMTSIAKVYQNKLNDMDRCMIWHSDAVHAGGKPDILEEILQHTSILVLDHVVDYKDSYKFIHKYIRLKFFQYTYSLKTTGDILKTKEKYEFKSIFHAAVMYLILAHNHYKYALNYLNILARTCLSANILSPKSELRNINDISIYEAYKHVVGTEIYHIFNSLSEDKDQAARDVAEFLYYQSANYGNHIATEGLTDLGKFYVKNKKYIVAERLFHDAMRYGNRDATTEMVYLARVHYVSDQSLKTAIALLQDNQRDVAPLLLDIGDIYLEKYEDYAQAEELYFKSFDLGLSVVGCRLIDLGTKYATELKNKSKARELYLKVAERWYLKDVLETVKTSEKKIKTLQLFGMVVKGNQKRYVELADIYKNELKYLEKAYKYYVFVDEWMRSEGARTDRQDLKSSFDYSGFNTMLDGKLSALGDIYQNELKDIEGALILYTKASDYKNLRLMGCKQEEMQNYDMAKQAYEASLSFGDDQADDLLIALGNRYVYELQMYDKGEDAYESGAKLGDKKSVCHLILLSDLYQTQLDDFVRAEQILVKAWDYWKVLSSDEAANLDDSSLRRKISNLFVTLGEQYILNDKQYLGEKSYAYAKTYGASSIELEYLERCISRLKDKGLKS